MSQFKVGDRVRRNSYNDEDLDGNDILFGEIGTIIEINYTDPPLSVQPYLVQFRSTTLGHDSTWWIRAECLEYDTPETQESKEQKVIAKIKYLNEKYAKSRTVSTQVVYAKQGEFGEGTSSIGCAAPRISPTTAELCNAALAYGNAIRSESARLRGIDAIREFGVSHSRSWVVVDELTTFGLRR